MWSSAADSHIKLRDRVVKGAVFLAGGVLECDLAHRQSVAVLCMLFEIRSYPMHPLSGASPFRMCRPVLLVLLWFLTCARLRLLAVELISTVQPCFSSQCLFGTILVALYLMMWDWRFLEQTQCFPVGLICSIFFVSYYVLFLPSIGWLC